jgi:hypothetical protein
MIFWKDKEIHNFVPRKELIKISSIQSTINLINAYEGENISKNKKFHSIKKKKKEFNILVCPYENDEY